MEDAKNALLELSTRLDNTAICKDLETATSQYRERVAAHAAGCEALNQNTHLVARKNAQIEAEIQRLLLAQARVSDLFNRRNNERLRLAKRLIDLEQKNEGLEASIKDLEAKIAAREEEIRRINSPSSDALYYEIIKGFGVDFVSRDGEDVARVRNRARNDIFHVSLSNRPVEKVCEEIWTAMHD